MSDYSMDMKPSAGMCRSRRWRMNRVVVLDQAKQRAEAGALWDLHLDHGHPHAPAGREAGAAAASPRALVS